jgi:tRNA threonylcarbamoyladenosine biosynthesis protein TsaB
MNLLAIDTATDKFSIALSEAANTWFFEADAGLRHSELVMDSVDMLMHKAGIMPNALNGVVCMGGPGSFTGLRIGFSIAKGLALSLGIPFAAIPTLDCMAWPFSSWPGIVVPVLDAKKKAFFCTLYRDGRQLCPVMDATPAEIATSIASATDSGHSPTLLIGPASQMLYQKLLELPDSGLDMTLIKPEKRLRWGNAETLLHMAKDTKIFDNNSTAAGIANGPNYIRKSDAEIGMGTRDRGSGIGDSNSNNYITSESYPNTPNKDPQSLIPDP